MTKDDVIHSYEPNGEYPSYYHESEIEKMLDDWAKQQSIGFAEWMSNNRLDFQPAKGGKWIGIDLVVLTPAELYTLFLNQSL